MNTPQTWRQRNRDKWNAYSKAWRQANPDKVKEYRRSYLSKDQQRVLMLRKESNKRRSEYIRKWNTEYYRKNRRSIIKQKSEYEKKRTHSDPAFKIQKRLRNRIIDAITRGGSLKSIKTKELIGCDRKTLMSWLESKFQNGMSWQNYGVHGWHVDHVIPCAAFDMTNPKHQQACFHYTNLRPLWATDNQRKGANIK